MGGPKGIAKTQSLTDSQCVEVAEDRGWVKDHKRRLSHRDFRCIA